MIPVCIDLEFLVNTELLSFVKILGPLSLENLGFGLIQAPEGLVFK